MGMMSGNNTTRAMRQIAELVDIPGHAGTRAIIAAFSEQFAAMAHHLAEDQVALFDMVFMEIARGSVVDERILLAERLAHIPNAPLGLVAKLACDEEIKVAGPILRHSTRVPHDALMAIAETQSDHHRAAIAVRKAVPQDLSHVLARLGLPCVLILLVNNPGTALEVSSRRLIVEKSFGHPDLFINIDKSTAFGQVIMSAYEGRGSALATRDADSEVAGYIGQGQIERALAIIAMEARTRHRVVMRAYQKDTLESFVVIARAANLSWGTMVGLLLNQFGISTSASQINESRRLFDDTTRREALNTTRIMGMADKALRG